MRKVAGDTVQVYSAATKPGSAINDLSAQALEGVGRRTPQSASTVVVLASREPRTETEAAARCRPSPPLRPIHFSGSIAAFAQSGPN